MTYQGGAVQPAQAAKPAVVAPKSQKEEITVHELAAACYKAARGDVKRAARIMYRKVTEDAGLLRQLSEEFIKITCITTTGLVLRGARRLAWLPPNYDPGGKGGRLAALARGNEEMLMAFPLPGGKPLGEATHDEVAEASAYYGKIAKDTGHKGRWLALVAARVPQDKIVKQALTEKKLRELQQESGHA